ncbi:3-mercaptopyruvate sulfurtransferase [Hoeflea poritis]|uniref:3-mercaptopyruvate sulfurtransferase n=1 Tax=Hoeflea poritis TaxID=2993659 RepID=A0ABT4VQ00_9HYPH|nr:3-mercaptopyruvate sulfurtransferase [Hoeflea poritis]MDA4846699.1 3-mercaptopyruvate sulfurtransferase [Hoeflea poritis]
MSEKSAFVVSADWLEERLGQEGLRIVDASWYLPAQERDARTEYEAGHIPGAVFFDQDAVVEPGADLPHTLPSPAVFADHASALGISDTDTIVICDGPGMFTSPRVWWMFRVMGAGNVFVLDGGIDGWKAGGRAVSTETPSHSNGTFNPTFDEGAVIRLAEMRDVVDSGASQIADARGGGRFTGEEAEPRPGMRSGHMPGARSVPVFSLSENGHLKSLDDLRATLEGAGIDPQGPVITTCGSGVTAAVITLALNSLGNDRTRLYDGSWSEWGARDDTPVETGDP